VGHRHAGCGASLSREYLKVKSKGKGEIEKCTRDYETGDDIPERICSPSSYGAGTAVTTNGASHVLIDAYHLVLGDSSALPQPSPTRCGGFFFVEHPTMKVAELFCVRQFSAEILKHPQQKMPYAAKGRNTCSAAAGGIWGIGGS
jgi:hypothetical protein